MYAKPDTLLFLLLNINVMSIMKPVYSGPKRYFSCFPFKMAFLSKIASYIRNKCIDTGITKAVYKCNTAECLMMMIL